jgi:AraC-like DNA-binding protein
VVLASPRCGTNLDNLPVIRFLARDLLLASTSIIKAFGTCADGNRKKINDGGLDQAGLRIWFLNNKLPISGVISLSSTGSMDPRIQIVLKIIAERKSPPGLAPDEAARLLGLSLPYLLRLFHREVGTKYGNYSRQMTLSRAYGLLTNYTRSIKEIATECGYVDLSNFYRDFKRQYGRTPREVRIKCMIASLQVTEQPDVAHLHSR